jgi:hypothetical protein
MIFAAPLVLLGLLALPAIIFILRLTPPPPRTISFPPIALLTNLAATQTTPRGIPLWLLLLRLLAAALVVIGLASPSTHAPPALPGTGPILIVIDNDWAAAADWSARRNEAANLIAAAAAAQRGVAILPTAPSPTGANPTVSPLMTPAQAAGIIAAIQPQPWPPNHAAAATALATAPEKTRIFISDGITGGADFPTFMNALHPARIIAATALPGLLTAVHLAPDGSLIAHITNPPASASILARTATGDVLASAKIAPNGDATITLPAPLANKIAALAIGPTASAAGTYLLDGSSHAVRIGLNAGTADADTPYLGPLYFIRRALPPGAQTATGDLTSLIAAKTNMIILADQPLAPAEQAAAANFIAAGGILLRFAGPLTAPAPDSLSPDTLLAGDRRLGGALTWATPQTIGPFPAAAFAGLSPDPTVTVSRQVLADPTSLDPTTVWASLQDGTPLILGTRHGKGYLIICLTTANADWSTLPLSGLFPNLLARIAALAQGAPPSPKLVLPLQSQLTAAGNLTQPANAASLTTAALPAAQVSPAHPPGLYGTGDVAFALNLGGHIPPPIAATLPGASPLGSPPPPVNLGPALIAAAILLLALDLLVSLLSRGLLRTPRLAILFIALFAATAANAQSAALQPTIGYILTGDTTTDQHSADALGYLSADVSAHTSAQLGNPQPVDPAVDDLAVYPLIYWPVLPATQAPSATACAALTTYMQHGGLLVIDTPGGDPSAPGSGAGFSPGAAQAVSRVTACLALPPLVPLTATDVLAHCFYIVPDFPGRFTGAPVLVAAEAARDADGVTPIIIAQNDWAGAWARDPNGNPEQTPIPGAEDQRTTADRFGTNLVIYALTGSYKGDQTDIPALLDKLGQ